MYQKKNEKNNLLKGIGVYEILGGLLGLFLIGYQLIIGSDGIDSKLLVIESIFFCFYILNIVSGILLFQSKKLGIWLSILCQFVQIFYLSMPTFKYILGAGSLFGIGFREGLFIVKFEIIYAEFLFSNATNEDGEIFLVNLIPLILVGILTFFVLKKDV
jgi:hypothetical protein